MREQAQRFMKESGLVAVIRGRFPLEHTLAVGETLAETGVTVLEVTLNSTDALKAIGLLRERLGKRALVGAGTVRTAAQLRQAIDVGAQFSVAPNLDLATVELANAADVLHLPGVFTPTEVEQAHRAGCQVVKLFPAGSLGWSYLKALRAPLDDVLFVPTGGISAENIGAYRRAGAFACGIGGALVTDGTQMLADLRERARALRVAWEVAV